MHCTYLVRGDVIQDLTYQDDTDRFEYVIFSDSARKSKVSQYLDNRQIYGYITFDKGGMFYSESGIADARTLLSNDLGYMDARENEAMRQEKPERVAW